MTRGTDGTRPNVASVCCLQLPRLINSPHLTSPHLTSPHDHGFFWFKKQESNKQAATRMKIVIITLVVFMLLAFGFLGWMWLSRYKNPTCLKNGTLYNVQLSNTLGQKRFKQAKHLTTGLDTPIKFNDEPTCQWFNDVVSKGDVKFEKTDDWLVTKPVATA